MWPAISTLLQTPAGVSIMSCLSAARRQSSGPAVCRVEWRPTGTYVWKKREANPRLQSDPRWRVPASRAVEGDLSGPAADDRGDPHWQPGLARRFDSAIGDAAASCACAGEPSSYAG